MKHFQQLSAGEVAMSVITHGELWYGACKSRGREDAQKALCELATMIPVLPISAQVGERYGEIRSELENSGRLVGNNDLWIAAHALALGVALVTNNARELARVSGLEVENWVERTDQSQVHEAKKRYRTRRIG